MATDEHIQRVEVELLPEKEEAKPRKIQNYFKNIPMTVLGPILLIILVILFVLWSNNQLTSQTIIIIFISAGLIMLLIGFIKSSDDEWTEAEIRELSLAYSEQAQIEERFIEGTPVITGVGQPSQLPDEDRLTWKVGIRIHNPVIPRTGFYLIKMEPKKSGGPRGYIVLDSPFYGDSSRLIPSSSNKIEDMKSAFGKIDRFNKQI